MKTKFSKCPHCGSTKGMYSKYLLYGLRAYYGFHGSEEHNITHAYQRGGKILYCQNCDRMICKLEDWEET